MRWLLTWLNESVATLKAMLQLLVIYWLIDWLIDGFFFFLNKYYRYDSQCSQNFLAASLVAQCPKQDSDTSFGELALILFRQKQIYPSDYPFQMQSVSFVAVRLKTQRMLYGAANCWRKFGAKLWHAQVFCRNDSQTLGTCFTAFCSCVKPSWNCGINCVEHKHLV